MLPDGRRNCCVANRSRRQVLAADEPSVLRNGRGRVPCRCGGHQFRSTPVRVTGQDQAQLDLKLVLAESVISGRIHNGVGRTLSLTRDGAQIATLPVAADETYRFAGLLAGTYRIAVAGTSGHVGAHHADGDGRRDR